MSEGAHLVSLLFAMLFIGFLIGFILGAIVFSPKKELEEKRDAEKPCPVENCRIRVPHSHAEAFVRRLREK